MIMAVVLQNVLADSTTWALTTEGQTLMDFATELLNLILNFFYTIAMFVKDFAIEHTMWLVFLMILGWLYAKFRSKTRRIWM